MKYVLLSLVIFFGFGVLSLFNARVTDATFSFTHRDWSGWGYCTPTACGSPEGIQKRTCEFQLFGTDNCTLNEVEYQACEISEEDYYECEEPSITPEATPEAEVHLAGGAEQCPNSVPTAVPANVHVVRNGIEATVNAHIPEGDKANVYFKESGASGWQHSAHDIPVTGKFLSYTVKNLNPDLGYTFGVQAANGCAGGEVVVINELPKGSPKTGHGTM